MDPIALHPAVVRDPSGNSRSTWCCASTRVAADVVEFVFYPEHTLTPHDDGLMTVRFTADGVDEMCWRLVTCGTAVAVEQPTRLRRCLTETCPHRGPPRSAIVIWRRAEISAP